MPVKSKKFEELLEQTEKYIQNREFDKAAESYRRLKAEYVELIKHLSKKEAYVLYIKIDSIYNKLVTPKTLGERKQIKQLSKKSAPEKIAGGGSVRRGRFHFYRFLVGKGPRLEKGKIKETKGKFKWGWSGKSYKEEIIRKRKHKLKFYLEKAGVETNPLIISKRLFNICVILNLIISSFLIFLFSVSLGYGLVYVILVMLVLWLLFFPLLLFLVWTFFYLFADLKIFKRKTDLEEVLPDFLQLTSANIRAGMTIEKALWYAVRPRFGVLAKEIETVAKDTMGGKDLREALERFSEKYDSNILSKSVSLLVEGIEAGGEIGSLLNKIALNIQESKVMRKEMAASVTTYVIFISFATIAAAPFLFALSAQLIGIIQSLSSTIMPTSSSYGFAVTFTGAGITSTDFRIFAVTSLLITSFFSSVIIATIKKGDIKSGIKYIPIFIISTIVWFLLASLVLDKLLGKMF